MSGSWTIDGCDAARLDWRPEEGIPWQAWSAWWGGELWWIVREGPRSFRLWAGDETDAGTFRRREDAEAEGERLVRARMGPDRQAR